MKILFIATKCNIFKINSGGANRNNMYVKALSEMGHVDVVSFNEEGLKSNIKNCDVIYSEIIHDKHHYVDSVVSWILMSLSPSNPYSYYKKDKKKETVIDGFVRRNNYDIIVCRYVDSVIKCGLLKYKDRLVIDVDENPTNRLRYQAAQVKNRLLKWRKIYESKRIGQMIDKLLGEVLCSFHSNQIESPSPKSVFLLNTISITKTIPDVTDYNCKRIMYVGCLNFFPSKHGICYFVENIFPMIRVRVQNAELCVVGEGKPELITWLNEKEGVKALGRVDDLTVEYQRANVVVIPIYHGSGTSVKFVEALFMNRPIVSTPVGVRGFEGICKDGVHYMLAENDKAFATKTIELLSSAEYSRQMAHDAYMVAAQNFSQEKFFEIVSREILSHSL